MTAHTAEPRGSSRSRINGLLAQQIFLSKRLLEHWFDLIFFSIVATTVFGFISKFLATTTDPLPGQYILVGMLLWEVIRITQYCVAVNSLWIVWSHNLSNVFITPISILEYMVSFLISSIATTLVVVAMLYGVIYVVFDFNLLDVGVVNLIWAFINMTMFAWIVSLVVLGLIFRFGVRIQALAWGIIFLFQPLCAAFFPLAVLPGPIQAISRMFPATYVFEAARHGLATGETQWNLMLAAFALNVVYLVLATMVFMKLFKKSKVTGQFARNDL